MNEKNVKTWVAAMRGDSFKQGEAALKQLGAEGQARHCCLGVACELAEIEQAPAEASASLVVFGSTHEDGLPPFELAEWLGLGDELARMRDHYVMDGRSPHCFSLRLKGKPFEGRTNILHEMNDTESLSFAEIADLVDMYGVEIEDLR